MKRIVPVVLAAALAVSFAGLASAQDFDRGMDRRDVRIERRWRAPRPYGREFRQVRGRRFVVARLTPREARWLRMHRAHVRAREWRDGRLSFRERMRMHRRFERRDRWMGRDDWNDGGGM